MGCVCPAVRSAVFVRKVRSAVFVRNETSENPSGSDLRVVGEGQDQPVSL